MDRATLLTLWTDSWDGDIWIAPWSKAITGLTAQQAAWTPAPGRHSIWQNVTHVVYWRNYTLDVIAGKPKPPAAEVEAHQFAVPSEITDAAWAHTSRQLMISHERIRAAIADPAASLDRIKYHLAHDAYHLGQIMQLRALQGLPPIV